MSREFDESKTEVDETKRPRTGPAAEDPGVVQRCVSLTQPDRPGLSRPRRNWKNTELDSSGGEEEGLASMNNGQSHFRCHTRLSDSDNRSEGESVLQLLDDHLSDSGIDDEEDEEEEEEEDLVDSGGDSVPPDKVLELVADRLRRIGDEMEDDIRQRARTARRDATRLLPEAGSNWLDLFPAPPTSEKRRMVLRDLADETLLRDLSHVVGGSGGVVRRLGRVIVRSALSELISIFADPGHFRSRWSAQSWTR